MSHTVITRRAALGGLAAVGASAIVTTARASKGADLDGKIDKSIEKLFAQVKGAREMFREAKGVLIMPQITKAGFIVGGAYGEGGLRVNGATVGYWSVAAASLGFQAGGQQYAQAMFFMTTGSLEKFRRSDGWEAGIDAAVTVPQDGIATGVSTTTAQAPVVAVVYGQNGLMAGVSMEGAKYSPITR